MVRASPRSSYQYNSLASRFIVELYRIFGNKIHGHTHAGAAAAGSHTHTHPRAALLSARQLAAGPRNCMLRREWAPEAAMRAERP
jgi:hypothetical protein